MGKMECQHKIISPSQTPCNYRGR